VADSNKHSSLLQYGIIYNCKRLYRTGPRTKEKYLSRHSKFRERFNFWIQNRTNWIRAIDADPVFELAKGPKNISRGEGSRLTVWKERERGFLERVLERREIDRG